MDENPNVKIVHNKAAESGDARANYFQKLGKEGLADIEAVEIDWFAEAMQYSDLLAEVPDSAKGRWLDWKEAAATDADGRLVGFGTDIGPQAICYRADLFAAAGLPIDARRGRRAVRRRLGQLLRRRRPVQGSHRQADDRLGQLGAPGHRQPDRVHLRRARRHRHRDRRTPSIEDAYNLVVERAVPNSAYAGQWSDDWNASMANGEFAAMLCPGWMLGIISGNAPDVTGWEIANVFPNGGGNWGGSYLTVPANGANVEAALALADWLTAPEQQVEGVRQRRHVPEPDRGATSDPELTDSTNAYFNDAPTGQIFADRAEAVTVAPYKRRGLLQVPRRAPERRHPGLRRPRRPADRRGTPTSPRSKPSDRSERECGSCLRRAARTLHRSAPITPTHHRRYGASRDRDRHPRRRRRRSRRAPRAEQPRRVISFSHRLSRWDLKLSPYLYISPFFILFAIVGLFPIVLHRGHLVPGMGPGPQLRRRSSASTSTSGSSTQPQFWTALRNTFSIFLLSTVPQLILALFIAAMLDRNIRAKTFWRMSVLLPFVMAPVAVALIFSNMFGDNHGLVNNILTNIGLQPDPVAQGPVLEPRRDRDDGQLPLDRLQRPDPPRRDAGRAPRLLRGGDRRRRERLPPVLEHHAPVAASPTLIFVIITVDHRRPADLRRAAHVRQHRRRRRRAAVADDHAVPLQHRLGRVQLRPSRGARVDPVPHHPGRSA